MCCALFQCRIVRSLTQRSPLQIRQVRQGISSNTKGTEFVVYEDVADAKQACDKLNGFNFQGRYLVGTCMGRSPKMDTETY